MVLKIGVIIRRQGTLGEGAVVSPCCAAATVFTEQVRLLGSSVWGSRFHLHVLRRKEVLINLLFSFLTDFIINGFSSLWQCIKIQT